ncbi:phage tail protein [Vreelandella neptunia]|uniref:Phage tail protein n=1 Tax=Vreelandella neptunia TaxID=115551 RepID=A0ABZ0YI92_9GAMM|nr:phage tail protein [Halomonas neptunia]MDN3562116.1 phage tail protein [Halomonas neptunia]WQH11818.1 phage tail protein [Halomonas neptunia]
MSQFFTLLTATGQDLLTQAMGFGQQIELTHMAVGDGGGNDAPPTESKTALVNEVYRSGVSSLVVDPQNPNWLVAELVIPTNVGGWTIREIGLFDINGNLFAVANFPETYKPTLDAGSGREITVRMTIQVSDTASVTLTIDQSVVFATRTYVDSKLQAHEQSRNHPDATTTAKGFVEMATSAEAVAGTSTTHAVTPAGAKAAIDQHAQSRNHPDATTTAKGFVEMATSAEAITGESTAHAVTPAGVKAHVANQLDSYGNTVDGRLAALASRLRLKTYFMGQN